MASPATTQSITNGQIGQINDRLATKLRESDLPRDGVQAVLAALGGEVIEEMVSVLRTRVEAVSEMIIREVEVDYDLGPQEAISATKRAEYLNDDVVTSMPRNGKGKKRVKVGFFPLRKYTGVKDVQKLIEQHGLKPDPYAVAKVNQDDPSFGDTHPNGTQWQDAQGNHCCLAFGRWFGDRRGVSCNRGGSDWGGSWWIGGVLASS